MKLQFTAAWLARLDSRCPDQRGEDIRDLTELTTARMEIYQLVGPTGEWEGEGEAGREDT